MKCSSVNKIGEIKEKEYCRYAEKKRIRKVLRKKDKGLHGYDL